MRITKNCFAVLGIGYMPPWTVNSGFITGPSKTLIIDSGPSYFAAQTIYGYASNIRSGNELLLINTEKHLDHLGGNCFFAERRIKIFGHELIKRDPADLNSDKDDFRKSILSAKRREANETEIFYKNTSIVNPDSTVYNGEKISLGNGVEVSVLYTLGHTETNISVLYPEEKVLYCGDCIINGYIPNLESGTRENWIEWLKSLDIISDLDLEFIVPGHGEIIAGDDIPKEIDRMSNILTHALEVNKAPTQE